MVRLFQSGKCAIILSNKKKKKIWEIFGDLEIYMNLLIKLKVISWVDLTHSFIHLFIFLIGVKKTLKIFILRRRE